MLTNEDYEQDLVYSPYVFVYGTLKKGYGNNRLLSDADFMCEATTDSKFYLCDTGFPYAIPYDCMPTSLSWVCAPVRGEVWKLSGKGQMLNLDLLEGVESDHYKREVVTVNDKQYTCWVYTQHDLTVLASTDNCNWKDGAWVWQR